MNETTTDSRTASRGDPFIRASIDVDDASGSLNAELLRLAAADLEAGHLRQAEQYLEQALARDPDDHRCRAYLAVCDATRQPGSRAAERIIQEIAGQHPHDPLVCFARGQVLLLAGRRREAFRLFARARRLSSRERALRGQLRRVDPRRPPAFPSLGRDHPLNVLVGRLRALFRRRPRD